jgi:hypothetical protein
MFHHTSPTDLRQQAEKLKHKLDHMTQGDLAHALCHLLDGLAQLLEHQQQQAKEERKTR